MHLILYAQLYSSSIMKIKTYLTPNLNDELESKPDSIFIYIDVLRASTSVCSALFSGAKEIIPAESMEKALTIYKNLSSETSILSGERNGIKPLGFLLGNSPSEFSPALVKDKSIVLTTTNGTIAFNLGKKANFRVLASFTNLTTVVDYIYNIAINEKIYHCNIVCAGNEGHFAYEDSLCAGAIINQLNNKLQDLELNDSSRLSSEIYNLHKSDLLNFIKSTDHAKILIEKGFENDIDDSLNLDKYPVLPIIKGNNIISYNSISKREN